MFSNIITSTILINLLNYTAIMVFPLFFFFSTWIFVYFMLKENKNKIFYLVFISYLINFIIGYFTLGKYNIFAINIILICFQVASAYYFSNKILRGIMPEKYIMTFFYYILFFLFLVFCFLVFYDYKTYEFLFFPQGVNYSQFIKNLDDLQKANLERVIQFLRSITFSLIITIIFSGIVLSFVFFNKVFASNNLYINNFDYKKMKFTKPNEYLIFVLILGILLMIFGKKNFYVLETIGRNLSILIAFVYFFNGIMLFEYFSYVTKVPKGFKFLVYVFLFFQFYLSIIFFVFGVFDAWIDFRKLIMKYNIKSLDKK